MQTGWTTNLKIVEHAEQTKAGQCDTISISARGRKALESAQAPENFEQDTNPKWKERWDAQVSLILHQTHSKS